MEHRIKAPSNKGFIMQEKGGTASKTLNARRTYTSRIENLHPYATSNYIIDTEKKEGHLENAVVIKDKKEEEAKELEKEKKRNAKRVKKFN